MFHSLRRALAPIFVLLPALVLLPAAAAQAACPSDAQVAEMARHFAEKRPGPGYGADLSLADAYCGQEKYTAILDGMLGERAGYKVGFTGKETQERFGVDAPARGVLYRAMLLPSGTELPAGFGARPLYEADLLVSVKDAGINDARTHLEVARHLDRVIPFIELPDIVVAQGRPLNGPGIIALNVLPRFGVTGAGVKVEPTPEFVDAMATMRVTLTDGQGNELFATTGEALMGHPFEVVLWLTDHLREHGMRLEAGDVVSLGSLGGLAPPEPGKRITLRYEGLPTGAAEATVSFK